MRLQFRTALMLTTAALLLATLFQTCEAFIQNRRLSQQIQQQRRYFDFKMTDEVSAVDLDRVLRRAGACFVAAATLIVPTATLLAADTTITPAISDSVIEVPLYNKRTSDVQPYSDVTRGFRLLRPFGFNEFDGAGSGYAVKFASLFDVDENVVVGSAPSAAGKESIADFGSVQDVGKKLLAKRGEGSRLVTARARSTNGVLFYEFEFENPVDESLPRPKKDRPSKIIELYQLCVNRGKLWSVQVTSNDKLFPGHEKTLRTAIASFYPQL